MPELLTISLQFTSLLGKTIHFSKIIITSLGQSESKHLCLYSIWLFPHMLTVASGAEQQGESKATFSYIVLITAIWVGRPAVPKGLLILTFITYTSPALNLLWICHIYLWVILVWYTDTNLKIKKYKIFLSSCSWCLVPSTKNTTRIGNSSNWYSLIG